MKFPVIKIQTKLFLVFLGVSLLPLIIFGYITQREINVISGYAVKASKSLGYSAANDSVAALENLGVEIVRQKARDVALQCKIFLDYHPNMTIFDLQKNYVFNKIAVQPVGNTGYTIVYEKRTGIMRFHPNRRLRNFDMHKWKDLLPEFWTLFEKSLSGNPGGGYYNWKDADGVIRRKYMYMTPIEGTPFMVAATTYIDEFSIPAQETRARIAKATSDISDEVNKTVNTIKTNFTVLFFIMVLTVFYTSLFLSRMITNPILSLIKGSKAIGQGDMNYRVFVRTGDELEELANSFNKMASDLRQYLDYIRTTTAEREKLQKELEIARNLQQRLLPHYAPSIRGLEIAAHNIPAQEVGGDFYDFIPVDINSWGFVIADVSGKGMPAAIFMGLSRTIIRASTTGCRSLAAAIKQANELICRDSTSGMFVTLFYAVYDEDNRRLRYVNAGHIPPFLLRSSSGEIVTLNARGIALGVIHGIDLQEEEIYLEKGDVIVCFTDGVTDAINEQNEPFGSQRLVEIVEANINADANTIVKVIESAVLEFVGHHRQFDDITLMVIKAV
ncbi:MAG: SpoIIE family protein phosphatase [Syntrophales bacterium]|nr:SpoIIE family protein phosphatase [Syntrophales bacterium]